ncbi:MAG: hypothetical protein HRU15_17985 [Planctomycetes bacterium]|nr:hypothetical protein [Planctomycetota bacterium]
MILACAFVHAEVAIVAPRLMTSFEQRNIRKQVNTEVRFITRHRSTTRILKDPRLQAIILPPCYHFADGPFEFTVDIYKEGITETYYLISYGDKQVGDDVGKNLQPEFLTMAQNTTVGLLDEYGRRESVEFIDSMFPGLRFERIIVSQGAHDLQTMLGLEVADYLIVRKSQYAEISNSLNENIVKHAQSDPVPWARLAVRKGKTLNELQLPTILSALDLQLENVNNIKIKDSHPQNENTSNGGDK